jgi:threonylcarbamoyladenosine tRNA methylthiotransferase MtaB
VTLKYSIVTYGCRVNQADSLGFEENLLARGAAPAASPDDADLVIVNTCSVTASADQSARQAVRRLARTNPKAQIVVTGCSATRRPEEFSSLPNVLRVVSNEAKTDLMSALAADLGLTSAERFGDGDGSCGAMIEPGFAGRTAYTLRVQTGCAQPCAYCIIPSTRGRPRSVSQRGILSEVGRVARAGFKEIALTGVHLGSYGRDLIPPSSLFELLQAIRQREELERSRTGSRLLFRISSLEPMDCTAEIVDLVADHDCFARHFHLPLQHGSNRVLSAMRRPYTIERYADLVDSVRARLPEAAIGADVIVGFPGEREDDVESLCQYLEHSPLTHLHVFPYSDRPGTLASSMPDKVPGAVVRERSQRVREIGRKLATKFRESQIGSLHGGLTIEDGSLVVTTNYLKLRIPPGRARNEWVNVRVLGVSEALRGELV